MLGLLACTIGEPDDGEPRHAGLKVGLDLDLPRFEADERMGDRSSEHTATVGAKASQLGHTFAPILGQAMLVTQDER